MNKAKGTISNPWTCEDPTQSVKRGEFYIESLDEFENWYVAVKDGLLHDTASLHLLDAGKKTFHFLGKESDKRHIPKKAVDILNRTSSLEAEPIPKEKPKSTLEVICETLNLESTASQEEIISKINEIMAVNLLIKNAIDEMS